jgi:hypothetical protein
MVWYLPILSLAIPSIPTCLVMPASIAGVQPPIRSVVGVKDRAQLARRASG